MVLSRWSNVMPDLHYLSAAVMAEKIRDQEISPVVLLEAHLARVDRLNPLLNAFIQIDVEDARRQARAAEAAVQRRDRLGPLHGVPLSIKSSIDVAGLRCEAGTRLRAGHIAQQDAPLVSRLRAAGAVILGVTNCPELLMAWETDNLLYGRTNNPWDLSRTAGGSSGGSGGHCVWLFCRRRRQRWWRLHPRARTLHGNLRAEADPGPGSSHGALS